MASEQDQWNTRRQERAARREKQRKEQKRLLLGLAAAAVVLLVSVVAIVAISRGGSTPPVETQPQLQETTPVATQPEQTTEPTSRRDRESTTTIHIKAAGDLNITDSVVASGTSQLAMGYDYTKAFMDVAPVLSDADLTVMNFEGNLSGEPYGSETTSAPQELVQALSAAGVDILQAANSCTVNNGLRGMSSTLGGIRHAGIEPVGAFTDSREFQRSKGYTICNVQGIKVAVVAFTKGVGSRGMPAGNEDCVNLLYTDYSTTYQDVDTEGITRILKDVAAEKPDITIAMLHWGSEYNDNIHESQTRIVSLMQKRGVDIILGTHPHMLHKIDFNQEKGTLVAYSLGDFYGDGIKGGTNYSIILDIEITQDNDTGETKITGYSYTPIYTLKEDECDGQRRVVRIREAMEAYDANYVDKITKSCYQNMEKALERIEARIKGSDDKKK